MRSYETQRTKEVAHQLDSFAPARILCGAEGLQLSDLLIRLGIDLTRTHTIIGRPSAAM
jgi:hypothetical protein